MLEKTRGIVLRTTPYGDSSVIGHIYTEQLGMQSYIMNGVRNQKGAIRPAHLMPLNLVELVAYHKENQEIHRINELKCDPILQRVHFDVYKRSMALFLTELLDACIGERESDPELFQFVWHYVELLDMADVPLSNFAIAFLLRFSRFLGFAPEQVYEEGFVLEMAEGRFVEPQKALGASMGSSVSYWCFAILQERNWMDLKIPLEQRRQLLDDLIRYYDLHVLHGRTIKSHHILREII
ncbi:MAG: DNA repair protein RecO [Flavobacteriales bacterium]|nr:DNA repair protein RecO [Flavobacteriales bacterium]